MAQYNLGISVTVASTDSIDQLRKIGQTAKDLIKETENAKIAAAQAGVKVDESALAETQRIHKLRLDAETNFKQKSASFLTDSDSAELKKIQDKGKIQVDTEEQIATAVRDSKIKNLNKIKSALEGDDDEPERTKKKGKQRVASEEETAAELQTVQSREITSTRKLLDMGVIDQTEAIGRINKVRGDGSDSVIAEKATKAVGQIRRGALQKELAETQAGLKDVERLRLTGDLTQQEAEKQSAAIRLKANRQRLVIAQSEAETLGGKAKSDAVARVIRLEAEISLEETKAQLNTNGNRQKSRRDRLSNDQNSDGQEKKQRALTLEEIEAREAASAIKILQTKLKAIEDEQAKSLALLKVAEQERLNLIQDGLNKQNFRKEDADRYRLETSRTALENELAFAEEARRKLDSIEASNPKAREELEKKKVEAAQKTAAITGKLLENEAAQQEFYRARAIAGIEREQAVRSRAVDLQIAQGATLKRLREDAATIAELTSQKEVAAINRISRSMETQAKLGQAQAKLNQARLSAALFIAEQSGDPGAIASVKLAQLAEQQRQQQIEFANQIKSQNLADRRAVIEAKINELKAKQAVLTAQQAIAEAALTAAKLKGEADSALSKAKQLAPGEARDKAIAEAIQQQRLAAESATAQKSAAATGLEVAKQGAVLAAQISADLQKEIAIRQQTQAIQQQTLNLEQQTAKARFDSEAAIGRQNALLQQQQGIQQNIAAAAQQTANARAGGGGNPPGRRYGGVGRSGNAYIVGEVEPEVFVPGADGWFLNQAQIAANLNRFTQARSIAGLQPIASASPGPDLLLREIKELRKLIAARSPVVNMPVTFNAPDTSEYDSLLKIQRSNLRGLL